MLKFIFGTVFGAFIGVMYMCLFNIVEDVDEFSEFLNEQIEAEKELEECEDALDYSESDILDPDENYDDKLFDWI